MKNIIIIFVILILVGVGGYFMFSKGGRSDTEAKATPTEIVLPSELVIPSTSPDVTASVSPSPSTAVQVKEFTVTGTSFKFTPAEIKVKKGDKVRIVFKNSGGMHDWVLDEFNARTKQIKSGETDTIEFVASKVGTFEYYCSVGTHRQMGMKGNFIVE